MSNRTIERVIIDLTGDDDQATGVGGMSPNTSEPPRGIPRPHPSSIYPGSRNTNLLAQQLRNRAALSQPPQNPKRKSGKKIASEEPIPRTSPNPKLTKFHFFSKLPIELRLKIWGYAILVPEKVRVTVDWTANWDRAYIADPVNHPVTFRALPSMKGMTTRGAISACRESLSECQKLLKECIKVNTKELEMKIPFNGSLDTIVMNSPSIFALQVCERWFACDSFASQDEWTLRKVFQGLEDIQTLLVEDIAYGLEVPQGLMILLRGRLHGIQTLKLNVGWPKEIEGLTDALKVNFLDAKAEKYWPDESSLRITALKLREIHKRHLEEHDLNTLTRADSTPWRPQLRLRPAVCPNLGR